MTSANPLFTASTLPYQLPPFADITPEHYEEAILAGMAEQRRDMEAIAADPAAATFANTLVAMERSGELLRRAESAFEIVASADKTPALEDVEKKIAPLLAEHYDAIFMDRKLYARVDALYAARDALGLDAGESWLLERYHIEFVRAGAHLDDADAERVKTLNTELATVCTDFWNRVRADTLARIVVVTDVAELDGMSDDAIEAAQVGDHFEISLLNMTAQPALAALTNRSLRERIFRASAGRCIDGGPNDTRDIITDIVTKRAEVAAIMGYPHFAAYQIADNTARTAEAVTDMLGRLAPAAVANARQEAADLQAIIGTEHELAAWDWAYYTEQVRKQRYGIDEAEIRPYLELERVLRDGIFFAAGKLYGVTFRERPDLHGYNDDVRVFEVFDADGSALGLYLADYYTRATKSGGAWMQNVRAINELEGTQAIVANNMNITKPPPGQPTLLTMDEVGTIFHEFGHALHGLFGTSRWPRFAGANAPRDFVEFPSQVNEAWVLDPEVLANYARHVETGEPLPAEIVATLVEAAAFNDGFATTEYLAASLLDLAWHMLPAGTEPGDVEAFERRALEAAGVALEEVPPRYRSGYFGHIFSGTAYAAGYYGYIWSEVLDADTVEWFRENGGLTRANGDRYRYELLAKCGGADAMQVYQAFRGRAPDVEPLLKRRRLTM